MEAFGHREQTDEGAPRPRELWGLTDEDPLVHRVDAARAREGTRPAVLRELETLRRGDEVLLVCHPPDPDALRALLSERGLASWAEERAPADWFVYFYRPHASAGAVAYRPLKAMAKAAGRG